MKIGYDVSQTGQNKAGCGYFADNLITNLAKIDNSNNYILYRNLGDHFWNDSALVTHIEQKNFQYDASHNNLRESHAFWNGHVSDRKTQLADIAILHCNNYFCPKEKINGVKIVYTLYDLSFITHPEYTTEANRVGCFDGVLNASLNADHIIAISDYSKKHFLETFPYYSAEKMSVVYPASRFENQTADHAVKPKLLHNIEPGKYWLNVGTIEPRKNYEVLLRAYAALKAKQTNCMPLVFAGKKGWLADDFEKLVEELNLKNDVIVLGYVNEAELFWLYQHCYCFLYPSYFEGFGLPVLEAMSLGVPVITSNTSSIPEIVEESCVLIEPADFNQLMQAMETVLNNPVYRDELSLKAKQQAEKFSWKRAAEQVLRIYNSMGEI